MKNAFINEQETKKALANFIVGADKLSMGEKCVEFEKEFTLMQSRKDAILFNSGGSANLALLQALKNLGRLKDGDRVGFSALTWSTNVMPIIQMGMKPVPIDCEVNTLNISSEKLLDLLKKTGIQAMFVTNVLGFAGDLDVIQKICKEKNILLLEDNCEALGTELPSGKTGNFGIASTFSLFVAHHMSTIEGGLVCTDDEELAEMLRITRANGWDRNLNAAQQNRLRKKYGVTSELYAKYTFYDLGFNMRPTEITGFIGLYQLKFLEENMRVREENYLKIEAVANKNLDLIPMNRKHISKLPAFSLPFVCKNTDLFNKYVSQFAGAGIEIRPMIAGNIQKQPFYKKYVSEVYDLPNADFLHDNSFYCGNYPEMTKSEREIIISCLIP
ncbi:MAG: aminotransferase class I/II-fold pyridoxal phosphate-dependent enzyme [Parcubacteria group bacterium]|nr:aminotransferase class I/II-fold pyridoxal phosphate-dependent enzyme [Parcubacteria group bacterium]